MMLPWWWRRWRGKSRKAQRESARKLAEAEAELAEVERDAAETLELARRMRDHARTNNFAQMVDAAFRARPRRHGGGT